MTAFVESHKRAALSQLRERCEKVLVECENLPPTPDLLRRLNLFLGNFLLALADKDPTVNRMAQGLQHLQDALMAERLEMSVELSDAILLTLDRIELTVNEGITSLSLPTLMDNLRAGELLDGLSRSPRNEQKDGIARLTELLAPEVRQFEGDHTLQLVELMEICAHYGLAANPDLMFFATLATPAEARLRRWQGRHARLLKLGLAMNQTAGGIVSSEQLAAALLVHDISMAFLPLDLLESSDRLSPAEAHKVHRHADISGCLLQNMAYWADAKLMIEHHHEWSDGAGYPVGLKDHQIHEGAKIIAIVDTFEAITHPPRFRENAKRPYLRAAMEINNHAGTQFSKNWVGTFNQTLKLLRGALW